MEEEHESMLHIVVFPWLAFGHILPFLELSKSLAKRGHRISFLSTPGNLRRLPAVPLRLSSLIRFIPLALPPVDGLPLDAEATIDLPHHQVPLLKLAFDGLAAPFTQLLASDPPDWIVLDFAQHWAPAIARESRIPFAWFSVFHVAAMVFAGPPCELVRSTRTAAAQYTAPPEWIPFPTAVAQRSYEARLLFQHYQGHASGVSDFQRLEAVVRGCCFVAVRSCAELEARWIRLLSEIFERPVLPVGFLMQRKDVNENDQGEVKELKLFQWLDGQAPRSVVYIAFGSEAALSVELVHQLALGIEMSEIPFLWALRRPAGVPEGVEILPEGFEERTRGRGVVATSWVPQMKVLAHASVGGFLTHCGWSSVMEALRSGHPLVMLPISPDQGIIARAMAEMGVGLEVERDEDDGSFGKEMVAAALRSVMVDGEGGDHVYRVKAEEVRAVVADDGCHERYVDDLVRYMKDHILKKKENIVECTPK